MKRFSDVPESKRRKAHDFADSSKTSFVYFFECEGYIKIGYAKEFRRRLANVKTTNPFPVTELGFLECEDQEVKLVELRLHALFFEFNTSGEWFRLSSEHKTLILEMCEYFHGCTAVASDAVNFFIITRM